MALTDPQLAALKSALVGDGLATTDAATVAGLPGYGAPAYRDTPAPAIAAKVDTLMLRVAITLAAQQTGNAQLQAAAISALGLLTATYTVQMSSGGIAAEVLGALQILVAGGVCTSDQATQILSVAEPIYKAGIAVVAADVTAAQAAIAADQAAADQLHTDEQRIINAYNAAILLRQGGETDMSKVKAAFDVTFG